MELDYEQLFMMRHGEDDFPNNRLSSKGRQQVKRTAEQVLPLLNQDYYGVPLSSPQGRTVDSLLVLGDSLIYCGNDESRKDKSLFIDRWAITDFCLEGNCKEDPKKFIEFANEHSRNEICFAVAHKDMMSKFFTWYLKKNFNTQFSSYDFNLADGVLINIKLGNYKIISSERGIIDL